MCHPDGGGTTSFQSLAARAVLEMVQGKHEADRMTHQVPFPLCILIGAWRSPSLRTLYHLPYVRTLGVGYFTC
jgi:hypothetical protein